MRYIDSRSCTIGYDTLAGGEQKDYANHIEDTIGCYCSTNNNLPSNDLYMSVTKTIASTIPDRGSIKKQQILRMDYDLSSQCSIAMVIH